MFYLLPMGSLEKAQYKAYSGSSSFLPPPYFSLCLASKIILAAHRHHKGAISSSFIISNKERWHQACLIQLPIPLVHHRGSVKAERLMQVEGTSVKQYMLPSFFSQIPIFSSPSIPSSNSNFQMLPLSLKIAVTWTAIVCCYCRFCL